MALREIWKPKHLVHIIQMGITAARCDSGCVDALAKCHEQTFSTHSRAMSLASLCKLHAIHANHLEIIKTKNKHCALLYYNNTKVFDLPHP